MARVTCIAGGYRAKEATLQGVEICLHDQIFQGADDRVEAVVRFVSAGAARKSSALQWQQLHRNAPDYANVASIAAVVDDILEPLNDVRETNS